MRQAFTYATSALKAGLYEANAWHDSYWGLGRDANLNIQAAVRSVYAQARQKLRHLDRIPYLLCRLEEPGVAARALVQFGEGRDHHRISAQFLSPDGLRHDVEQLAAGGAMSARLRAEVISLWNRPMGDAIADGASCEGKEAAST